MKPAGTGRVGQMRQLGSWNREMMPNVTGVRAEVVQATGYELASSEESALVIFGFHVLLP